MHFDELRTTDGLDVDGKRVLLRVDLNVPMRDGVVGDTTRLERIAPAIRDLSARGARVIVMSHFERPKARDPKYSLKPIAEKLAEVLGRPVAFAEDCVGPAAEAVIAGLKPGEVAVLENLRFHKGESRTTPGSPAIGGARRSLCRRGVLQRPPRARLGRGHHALPALLRRAADGAGNPALRAALEEPQRPTAAVVGGSKISTKIATLKNLVAKVDKLIIGGGMANTFLQAHGVKIGRSLSEPDLLSTGMTSWRRLDEGCAVVLPSDAVIAREFKRGPPPRSCRCWPCRRTP